MRAFQKIPECEKCGNIDNIKVRYIDDTINEELAYECMNCTYKWITQVKKQIKQEPETIVEVTNKVEDSTLKDHLEETE